MIKYATPRYLGKVVILALAYFLLARLGLALPFSGEIPTLFWPATAASIAILLIAGLHFWPGVMVGAIAVALSNNHSLPLLVGVVVAHTVEIALVAWLLRRWGPFDFDFGKFSDIRQFIAAAIIVGPFVGACLGVLAFGISPEGESRHLLNLWWEWWAGHAISTFIVLPAVLTSYNNHTFDWSRRQIVELLFVFATMLVVSVLIFVRLPGSARNLPLGHVVFPFLLWLALRFTPRELTFASLLVSILALAGTVAGTGPFSRPQPEVNLLLLLTFVGSVVLTALIIAAITMQRRTSELSLAKRNDELEDRVAARTADLQIANTHLEQTRDQAVEALILKNQILANVSHDARTPLNVITLYTEILLSQMNGSINEKQRERLNTILASSDELLRFINNLLDEAQLSANKSTPDWQLIDIVTWLGERHQIMYPLAERKGLLLSTSVADEMPRRVAIDVSWLNQIFNNLVDNAIKFTNAGAIDVKISPKLDQGMWCLIVADNGIGLSEADRHRVFDAFWQVDGSTTRQVNRGVGLGLSIVKQRVQLLGGNIQVTNRETGGAIFTVEFPLQTQLER